MLDFISLSGFVGASAFGLLSVLLLAGDRGQIIGRLLIGACISSALWFAITGAYYSEQSFGIPIRALTLLEIIRDAAWLLFLLAVYARAESVHGSNPVKTLSLGASILVISAFVLALIPPGEIAPALTVESHRKTSVLLHLIIAIFGLLMVEQLIRRTRQDSGWAIKHLCIGVGALFVYDFYLYADALLFNRVDPGVWAARGASNALAVPFLALAAARNRSWDLDIFVSRRVVFHSTAALGAGAYLLLMSAAGYYLNSYGGSWGQALRAVFFFGAILFLVALIFSVQIRSRLRNFLAKHFYKNRYEYGEVWLTFTRSLSTSGADPEQLQSTMLRAVVDIIDSTGGIMWCKGEDNRFRVAANYSMVGKPEWQLAVDHQFITRIASNQESIEIRGDTFDEFDILTALPWIAELPRAWIAVPILQGDELLAFLILAERRSNEALSIEDRDLLQTIGRQAASYLAFQRANEALSEARQFEAFNRLSAFLVHDLKNVVAQLTLIVRNAERHRDNPEFIDDAFTTIGDATGKINRMLTSLRQENAITEGQNEIVDLRTLVEDAVRHREGQKPVPSFKAGDKPVTVYGSSDRLLSVFEHLIQNAQDATEDTGSVAVTINRITDEASIVIADTGTGMDEDFIRTRLFRPFDTTKGKAGMGIGVYESRHVIADLGGRLEVDSAVGHGTSIKISLPCMEANESIAEAGGMQASQR